MRNNAALAWLDARSCRTVTPPPSTIGNVLAVTGWSHSTLYNRIKAGRFPAPMKDGLVVNHWNTDDVREALGP